MDTIFMNSVNSRTSEYHVHRKTEKAHIRIINLKYLPQRRVIPLTYLMEATLLQIFKIIF